MVSFYYIFYNIIIILVILDCNVEENDKKNLFIKSLNTKANYELILTEDCFLLLKKLDTGKGKKFFGVHFFLLLIYN